MKTVICVIHSCRLERSSIRCTPMAKNFYHVHQIQKTSSSKIQVIREKRLPCRGTMTVKRLRDFYSVYLFFFEINSLQRLVTHNYRWRIAIESSLDNSIFKRNRMFSQLAPNLRRFKWIGCYFWSIKSFLVRQLMLSLWSIRVIYRSHMPTIRGKSSLKE